MKQIPNRTGSVPICARLAPRWKIRCSHHIPVWGLAAAIVLAGCSAAKVTHLLTADLAANDSDSQLAFWHTLAERPVTSNDEAFHGLLLFLDDEDPAEDYAGRVEMLRSQQMLPTHFDRPPDEAILRGTLAVAITRMLDLKGGLMMRLVGPTPRYATRELLHEKIYPLCSSNQTFSGAEFLGIIGRIEDYQRINHPVDSPTIRSGQEQPANEAGEIEETRVVRPLR